MIWNSWLALLLLCAFIALLVACGGNNEEPTPTTALVSAEQLTEGSQIRVVCSQSCKERAQCGTRQDGSEVVLMSRGGPAVDNHDMVILSGTAVTVQESRAQDVREVSSQIQFPVTFLRVLAENQAEEGWVTQWCLGQ
jgi:hypothetical protein